MRRTDRYMASLPWLIAAWGLCGAASALAYVATGIALLLLCAGVVVAIVGVGIAISGAFL